MLITPLEPQHVHVFETFVVPRFLSLFGAIALGMLLPCDGAIVANLGCRCGFPDGELPKHLPRCRVYGFDASEEAIHLARNKAALYRDTHAEYSITQTPPFPAISASFSHVISIYPIIHPSRLHELVAEAARLTAPGGQILLTIPLRGSYQELIDILKEYSLKHDDNTLAKALETTHSSRHTIETFSETLEDAGLQEVDVHVRQFSLPFASSLDFFEDPITRLMVLPDIQSLLGPVDLQLPRNYVRSAIDNYWAEFPFELSLNIGCASARRM
ncbi:MAG: class I SAM-dependent methyltransferase [Polyangiaceae bacterium]|nr:class I SAM-dependent methyltransferase [Polyangiaceae bacterium]